MAVLLDGRGLYGKWEGRGIAPTDLDACGGHFGFVPNVSLPTNANENGDTFYGASTASVYHYHVQDSAPFFAGCFGPVSSLQQVRTTWLCRVECA